MSLFCSWHTVSLLLFRWGQGLAMLWPVCTFDRCTDGHYCIWTDLITDESEVFPLTYTLFCLVSFLGAEALHVAQYLHNHLSIPNLFRWLQELQPPLLSPSRWYILTLPWLKSIPLRQFNRYTGLNHFYWSFFLNPTQTWMFWPWQSLSLPIQSHPEACCSSASHSYIPT